MFATGGHDKYVALWRRQKLIWTTSVGYEIIALSFHPYGAALAAGSSEGHLIVINAENGATMLTIRVCGSPLNAVEFNQGKPRTPVRRTSSSLTLVSLVS